MNINNINELYQFLITNGLSGICQESQTFISCIDVLSRMCSCDTQQSKKNKYNQCVQNYIAFVSKSPSISQLLLSKINDSRISFYLNNQLINSINR